MEEWHLVVSGAMFMATIRDNKSDELGFQQGPGAIYII